MSKSPSFRPVRSDRVTAPPPVVEQSQRDHMQAKAGFEKLRQETLAKNKASAAEAARQAEIARIEQQIETVRAEARALVRRGILRGADQ